MPPVDSLLDCERVVFSNKVSAKLVRSLKATAAINGRKLYQELEIAILAHVESQSTSVDSVKEEAIAG